LKGPWRNFGEMDKMWIRRHMHKLSLRILEKNGLKNGEKKPPSPR
jgi:hypothetical protein